MRKTGIPFGAAAGLASAALFGASTPLAKALLGAVEPWMLAGVLYFGSGVGLLVWFVLVRRSGGTTREAPLRRRDVPWLLAVIASGGVAGPVLLMFGLSTAPAASAALLLNLEGLFTLAIAWAVFRENADGRIAMGALAIVTAAALLSWDRTTSLGVTTGALWIAAACLAWAVDNNLTRKLSGVDPVQITMLKGLVAGAVNIAIAAALGSNWPTPGLLGLAALVGLFGYGVSIVLFMLALRHVGAARAGAYFSIAPFVGAALAIVLLGDAVTMEFLVAAILVALGLYLHLAERHEHAHEHEPMTHEHRHRHDEHHRHDHGAGGAGGEPHSHVHVHARLVHGHPHYPDLHHRHPHAH